MTHPLENERRRHPRHSYGVSSRPLLKIDRQEFEVVDYSRNGLRIAVSDQHPMAGWIKGVLCLAGHDPIHIDAIVVRRQDGEMGLRLIVPLPD